MKKEKFEMIEAELNSLIMELTNIKDANPMLGVEDYKESGMNEVEAKEAVELNDKEVTFIVRNIELLRQAKENVEKVRLEYLSL